MGNIKFKKILEEAAWDRTQGKALPTLEDVQKAYDAKKHLQEELPIEEGDKDTYTWKQINDVLFDLRMPDNKIMMVLKALKKL